MFNRKTEHLVDVNFIMNNLFKNMRQTWQNNDVLKLEVVSIWLFVKTKQN